MSYQPISVREAVNKINGSTDGWYLPYVQRPYVWGSRYESELYICKLFDSLLRGYPIGMLILWNTEEKIAYREFMKEYDSSTIPKIANRGMWGKKDKWLVYDGQQRLQTLYSCLKYTFNDKILVFNLLFDLKNKNLEQDETGFKFVSEEADVSFPYIRINEVFSKLPNEKGKFRRELLISRGELSEQQSNSIEDNIDNLWKVFVETDKKSLGYFPISQAEETIVNEIFERLNRGGVALSQADLLFSRIKEIKPDFEQKLQEFSRKIYNNTGKGYFFDAYTILQLIYLISKDSSRVDPKKVKSNKELESFVKIWNSLETPLNDFFVDFIWGQFKINNSSIIPRRLALLPMMVYFYSLYNKGINFKKFTQDNILKLKQYLILSQVNDWNLQGIVDNFNRIIKESTKSVSGFPLDKMKSWLSESKKREIELFEVSFVDYQWFSLKVLMPDRIYQFDPDMQGRFNPEIDHIFPEGLEGQNKKYYKSVDVIWNMQPVKGDINNFKRVKHPKEFFLSEEGSKYINDYDFLPSQNLNNAIWNAPLEFIKRRREIMIGFLNREYKLEFRSA